MEGFSCHNEVPEELSTSFYEVSGDVSSRYFGVLHGGTYLERLPQTSFQVFEILLAQKVSTLDGNLFSSFTFAST
jgi:hypothetical protein